MQQTPRPTIVLVTDFGLSDTYVGVMKGVIAGIAPQATVIDLTHAIPPQDVQAAFAILTSYQDFPSGTIFCCVVDPEVGSGREALALETPERNAYTFVFPDNGLLMPILQEASITKVVRLDNPAYHHKKASNTFHGRDIFAPVSAHLAAGVALEHLGSPYDPASLRRLEWPQPRAIENGFEAHIIHIDHFGNLVTNVKGEGLEGPRARWIITCGGLRLRGISATFADALPGETLAYLGSSGYLELAIRQGNAAQSWNARRGDPVRVLRGASR